MLGVKHTDDNYVPISIKGNSNQSKWWFKIIVRFIYVMWYICS
jgi:hypothetical protein